jgi:hypothetical protein
MKNIKKGIKFIAKMFWAVMPLIIILAIMVYDGSYHYSIVGE